MTEEATQLLINKGDVIVFADTLAHAGAGYDYENTRMHFYVDNVVQEHACRGYKTLPNEFVLFEGNFRGVKPRDVVESSPNGQRIGTIYSIVGNTAYIQMDDPTNILPEQIEFHINGKIIPCVKTNQAHTECFIKYCDRKKNDRGNVINGKYAKCVFRDTGYTDDNVKETVDGSAAGQHYRKNDYDRWLKGQRFEETPRADDLVVNI